MLLSQAKVHLQSIADSNGRLPANVHELMTRTLRGTDPDYSSVASHHPGDRPVRCDVSYGPATVNPVATMVGGPYCSVTAASKDLYMFGSRHTIMNTVDKTRGDGGALYVEVKRDGNTTTYEHFCESFILSDACQLKGRPGSNGKHGARPIYFSTIDHSKEGVIPSALLAEVYFGISVRSLKDDMAAFLMTRLGDETEKVIVSTSRQGLNVDQQPKDEDWPLVRLQKPLPWKQLSSLPNEAA
jgi:hypothetical protein